MRRGRAGISFKAINFAEKFALFGERWQPKVVAEMNDYQFKVVKLQGDFVWHCHNDTDETFIVLDGVLRIDLRDGAVAVSAGEMFVVPKGVEHKPYAEREVNLLLIEPRGVPNTGDAGGDGRPRTTSGSDRTAPRRTGRGGAFMVAFGVWTRRSPHSPLPKPLARKLAPRASGGSGRSIERALMEAEAGQVISGDELVIAGLICMTRATGQCRSTRRANKR